MNYWVLGGTSEICYILDSGYNVWDFSYSGIRLLSQFIDIIGVNGNKANVSVLELSPWGDVCPYVQTDYLSYNIYLHQTSWLSGVIWVDKKMSHNRYIVRILF